MNKGLSLKIIGFFYMEKICICIKTYFEVRIYIRGHTYKYNQGIVYNGKVYYKDTYYTVDKTIMSAGIFNLHFMDINQYRQQKIDSLLS